MATPEGCPCSAVEQLAETVKELKRISESHERKLADGTTNFALIKQDLEYIKGNLDSKKKFNGNVLQTVINAVLTIAIGYIAVKLGLQ